MNDFDFDDAAGGEALLAIPSDDGLIAAAPDAWFAEDRADDDLPHLDQGTPDRDLVGDPVSTLDDWHMQERTDSCAVVSQEFVLEAVTGQQVTEDELVAEATQHGWYVPGGGTAMADVGNLLDAHGVPTSRWMGASVDDLQAAVATGDPVIVALDADEVWAAGHEMGDDTPVGDGASIPGQDANHAVTVTGFDVSDPERPMVVLNDPGHADGRALLIPADEFVDAWDDSGRFMVTTQDANAWTAPMPAGESPGDFVNDDGTYSWTAGNEAAAAYPGPVARRWRR